MTVGANALDGNTARSRKPKRFRADPAHSSAFPGAGHLVFVRAKVHGVRRSLVPYDCAGCGRRFWGVSRDRYRIRCCSRGCVGTHAVSALRAKFKGRRRPDLTPDQQRAQIRAQGLINMRVRRGLIQKPAACESCGRRRVRLDAHHDDYNQPEEVRWLCRSCHTSWHLRHDPIPWQERRAS